MDGGEGAVGCAEVDRAAPKRSGGSSSPQPHKPVAVWTRVRVFLAEGRGKPQRPGGHHRWRRVSVAQPRGTSRVERLGQDEPKKVR
jgi:hypothetical protein